MKFFNLDPLFKWLKAFLLLEESEFNFSRKTKIDLFDTEVSGLNYYGFSKDLQLSEGDFLLLLREPNNQYDSRAIEVYTFKKVKLGYLPKLENHIPTLIADQGVELIAEILEIHYVPKQMKLRIYQLL